MKTRPVLVGAIALGAIGLVVLATIYGRPWVPTVVGPERLALPVLLTPGRSLWALAAIAAAYLLAAGRRRRG